MQDQHLIFFYNCYIRYIVFKHIVLEYLYQTKYRCRLCQSLYYGKGIPLSVTTMDKFLECY